MLTLSRANCKSAKDARADALERLLGLRPPSPSDSDEDDSEEGQLEPFLDEDGAFDILWDPYSSDEEEDGEEFDELDSAPEDGRGKSYAKGKNKADASVRVKEEPREPELAAPEAQYEPVKDSLSFDERERELSRMGSEERDAMRVEWEEFFGSLVDRDRAAAGLGPRKRAAPAGAGAGRGLSPPSKIAKASGSGSDSDLGSSSAAAKASPTSKRSYGLTPTPSPPTATLPKAASKSGTPKSMPKFDVSSLTGSATRQALGLGGSRSGSRTLGGSGGATGSRLVGGTNSVRGPIIDLAGSPSPPQSPTREGPAASTPEDRKLAFLDRLRTNPRPNMPPRGESSGRVSGSSGDGSA